LLPQSLHISSEETYRGDSVVLTDGGIETRLIYEFGCSLPEFASFLALLEPKARAALSTIYRSYLAVAREFGMTMQLGTPTWRAHPECLARLGFGAPGDVERVSPVPLRYLIGCVHPTRLSEAFAYDVASLEKVAPRIAGLKANASTLPPDQLDTLDHLNEGSAAEFADDMMALRHAHGFGILGGCCGTSDRHIRALAAKLAADGAR
jgi:S-methylmethionine-dependent homocysteine/selenocysteine methylase